MKNIKCSIEAFVNGNAKSGQESFEMAQEHIEELITKKIENTPYENEFDTICDNILDECFKICGYELEEINNEINKLIDREISQFN